MYCPGLLNRQSVSLKQVKASLDIKLYIRDYEDSSPGT
jgi:hypothetical protein